MLTSIIMHKSVLIISFQLLYDLHTHRKLLPPLDKRGSREVFFFKYFVPGSLKVLSNFHGKTHPILLKTVDLCLEMSSELNYNFGLVVEEIFDLRHTSKSRCFDSCKNSHSQSDCRVCSILNTLPACRVSKGLASFRRSIGWGAARKTAGEKVKKARRGEA